MIDVLPFAEFLAHLERSRKRDSFGTAVPRFAEFLDHPHKYLAEQTIEIGPPPRLGTSLFLGIFFTVVLMLPAMIVLGTMQLERQGGVIVTVIVVIYVLSVLFAHWLTGGVKVVLHGDGIEIHDGWSAIFCPWSLFQTPGVEVSVHTSHAFLPTDPRLYAQIEKRRHGMTVMQGSAVRNQYFRISQNHQAVLGDGFRVDAGELAFWIRVLASQTSTEPKAQTNIAPAEPFMPTCGVDGWITMPVTRVMFPQVCCSCGCWTSSFLEVCAGRGSVEPNGWLPTDMSDSWAFRVPCCFPCQQARGPRDHRISKWGTIIGALIGLAPASLMVLENGLIWESAFLVVCCGLMGYWLGRHVRIARTPPIRARRFSVGNGTVELRFREPWYEDAFLDQFRFTPKPPND